MESGELRQRAACTTRAISCCISANIEVLQILINTTIYYAVFNHHQATQLEKDLNRAEQMSERYRTQLADFEARNKRLSEENKQMEQSVKQILQALKDSTSKPGGTAGLGDAQLLPTLERLCLVSRAWNKVSGNRATTG